MRSLVTDVSAAHAVGAEYVTTSPFRARALARRPATGALATAGSGIGGAVWADVPWLPDADPALLVKIASKEERVHNLRRSTAGALRAVQQDDIAGSARAIAGIADDLRDAADKLAVTLRRNLVLNGLVPAGLTLQPHIVTGSDCRSRAAGAGSKGRGYFSRIGRTSRIR